MARPSRRSSPFSQASPRFNSERPTWTPTPLIVPAFRTSPIAEPNASGAPTASTTTSAPRPSVAPRTSAWRLLGQVDGRRAELARQLQPLGDRVDGEDMGRTAGHRRLHRAEADRAEAEHRDRVAGAHPGVGDRVVAGPHHVAGEERRLRRHPLRHLAQDEVGEGDHRLVGLGAGQRPEGRTVAEGAAALAAVVVAADAGGAAAAGDVEAAEHAVADGNPVDGVADRQHRADVLVADRRPRLDRDAPVVDVEVGAADPRRLDRDDRLVGRSMTGSGRSSIRTSLGAW